MTNIPLNQDINVGVALKETYPYLEPCPLSYEGPNLDEASNLGEIHGPGVLGFVVAYPSRARQRNPLTAQEEGGAWKVGRVAIFQAYPMPEMGVKYGDDGVARVVHVGEVAVNFEEKGEAHLSWDGATGVIAGLKLDKVLKSDELIHALFNRLEAFLVTQGCTKICVTREGTPKQWYRQIEFLRARGYRASIKGYMKRG